MTVIAALCAVAVATWSDRRVWAATGLCLVALVASGLALVAVFGLIGIWAIRRVPRRGSHTADESLVAEVVALGLSAGLSFRSAAAAAAEAVPGETSAGLMRSIRRRNDASATPDDRSGLYVVARRALSTGAPLLPAVAGHAATLRSEQRSKRLTAARRLPVKLLFPLALLILPGFLILTVGPAILGSLDRLGM